MSYDAYQTTTADTYISLSNLRDETGTPISVPESEKELIAHGTGLVSGSLAFVGGKLLARYSPLLKNIGTSKYLSQLMSRGGDTATREGFKLLGSIASEASEEGLQEFVQIAAEEIGKSRCDRTGCEAVLDHRTYLGNGKKQRQRHRW